MEPERARESDTENGAGERERKRETERMEPMRAKDGERELSPRESEREREIKGMEPELYRAILLRDFDYKDPEFRSILLGQMDIFNQTTPMGNNVLHVAAQHERVNFIRKLLDVCPSLVQSLLLQGNHTGDTPLHIAAKVGSHHICKIFIDFARAVVSDVEGGQVDWRKELLQMANVDKDTALHYAVRCQCSPVAELLIEEDPELCNITNNANESPLYLATIVGSSEITKKILDASPKSFSHEGPRGMTALHAAIYYNSHAYNFVKAIVERRWQMIRERDDIGWTPLHYAACYDKVEATQLFVQYDRSVAYLLDNDGESALHIAAFLGHIDVIKELIESLPDACELINNKGQTALHTAVIGGRLNAVEFILETPSFEHLINKQDKDGNSALHLAVVHRRSDIMNFLARQRRVDIGLSNKEHKTALGIYDKQEKVVYEESLVYKMLKIKFGVQFMQDQAIKCVKERLENQSAHSQLATSTTTINNNMSEQEKADPSKESAIEISKVTVTLIATVTFAAAITVPGGLNSQGMANFAGKVAFKVFLYSNITAFYFSLMAMYYQFVLTSSTSEPRLQYPLLAGMYKLYLPIAITGMGVAFACGTWLVIPKTTSMKDPQGEAYLMAVYFAIGVVVLPVARSVGKYAFKRRVRPPHYEYGVKYLR